jgi:alkanesulfonate monooxygenase SsuD/methylene tetrahydromethanopterin reductase-like flavin-dependent oxidoreductase (luciferase family)
MFNGNKLKLGLFSPNCSGGMAVTTVPERWEASWDNNLALGRLADEAGIEFLLPIARWIGYGGSTDFQGETLETITWASALLASTRRISVFATAHTAFTHPIVAAKQFATMDQVGHGRFGLNVVCGWNKPEYDMFGIPLPSEHTARYAFGQEWFDIVTRIWESDAPFDWDGDFFHLRQVHGAPKPFGGTRPPVMNAGSSTEGREFAARNADFLFTVLIDIAQGAADVESIKERARTGYDRDIDVFTTSYVVCRPTAQEARDYHAHYVDENADWPAVDRLMELQGLHAKSFPPEAFALFRNRFAAGHGVYPLIGDPDQVADELEKISGAGFAGTTLAFVNYLDELPFFVSEVLPRLEAKGLRVAPDGAVA